MSDQELRKFIPKYGDRKAIQEHIKESTGYQNKEKKNALLCRLREKLKSKTSRQSDAKVGKDRLCGNQNARKDSRKVDIGWMNYCKDSNTYKQVKCKKGGGTRTVDLSKWCTEEDVISKGKELFFPHGRSVVGHEGDFSFKLMNFAQEEIILKGSTIEQIYNETCLSRLKFYLASKKIDQFTDSCETTTATRVSDDVIVGTDTGSLTLSPSLPDVQYQLLVSMGDVENGQQGPQSDVTGVFTFPVQTGAPKLPIQVQVPSNAECVNGVNTVPAIEDPFVTTESTETAVPMAADAESEVTGVFPVHTSTPKVPVQVQLPSNIELLNNVHTGAVVGNPHVNTGDMHTTVLMAADGHHDGNTVDDSHNFPNVSSDILATQRAILNDLETTVDFGPVHESRQAKKVHVNRVRVLKDMIDVFKGDINPFEDKILVEMVLPNGEVEIGEDSGGVLRDCLTQFWSDFYSQCAVGQKEKVPYLRHDFGTEEWESVGKIIVLGWKQVRYFPISISPVIMEMTVKGVSTRNIVDAFFNVISQSEATTFKSALENFDMVDSEELVEVLDIHQARKLATEINIKDIVTEIAHKEILQEPRFIIECWAKYLRNFDIDLEELYNSLEPTTQRVLKRLKIDDSVQTRESSTFNFLKKFIRDCDTVQLERFLRFCTGSNLLSVEVIYIRFNQLSGIMRRPVAHTCGCVLELSIDYENYLDFKHEFDSVLRSEIWVMDIV